MQQLLQLNIFNDYMRKASCLALSVVAFAVTMTQAVQAKALVQRASNPTLDRSYVQVAAAAMWPDFSKIEHEVVPNIVHSLGDDLKRAVQDKLRFRLGNFRLAQSSADADAARYILAELGKGREAWVKALSQVAGEAVKISPPQGAAVRAEADSAMSLWEKIKSLFSRKQAQNKAEVASIDAELETAVGKYILAENSNIFDSLFNKIKNVADKDINIAKNDFATAKKDLD